MKRFVPALFLIASLTGCSSYWDAPVVAGYTQNGQPYYETRLQRFQQASAAFNAQQAAIAQQNQAAMPVTCQSTPNALGVETTCH